MDLIARVREGILILYQVSESLGLLDMLVSFSQQAILNDYSIWLSGIII